MVCLLLRTMVSHERLTTTFCYKLTLLSTGRAFAGVLDFPAGTSKITAGEFEEDLLGEDIHIKKAEALRATIHMLVTELPTEIKGKTLICKVDNQVLKAVWERKGFPKSET